MRKLLALLLSLMLMMSVVSALAEGGEPIKLTLWTFQELHTELYQVMLDKWNAEPDKPTLEIDFQVFPYEDMHNKLTVALQRKNSFPAPTSTLSLWPARLSVVAA